MSEWRREFERAQAVGLLASVSAPDASSKAHRRGVGIMSGLTSRRVCSCNGRRSAGAGVR